MSLELVNTLATFGTFVVIAATAIAAIVQLRHARSSNQIAALNELRETMETPEFQSCAPLSRNRASGKGAGSGIPLSVLGTSARTGETKALDWERDRLGEFFEEPGR